MKNIMTKSFMHMPARDMLLCLLMLIPFVTYLSVVSHYAINVPFWDDFVVVLQPVNDFFSAHTWAEKIQALMRPNDGHLPLVTHIIAISQVIILGDLNFRLSLIAANFGWILTTLLLVVYTYKRITQNLFALLPIPFFMLTINHWESMDFVTPAWQMYWGAGFFPVLCFLSILERRILLASIGFTLSIYLSSGSLAIFPVVVAFCFYKKQWANAALFLLFSSIPLLFFLHMNAIGSESNATVMPSVALFLRYIPAFFGNLVSNGKWDLTPLSLVHIPIGILVIVFSVQKMLSRKPNDASAMIFLYLLLLAFMAAYVRSKFWPYVVSRYSLFASLSAVALYMAWLPDEKSSVIMKQFFVPASSILAAALWLYSLLICQAPLEQNQTQRLGVGGIQAFISHSTETSLIWEYGTGMKTLENSRLLGVYDYNKLKN